jgi:redox-sensing transcriptional repressor
MPALKVPDIVVGRLPLYLRALTQMIQEGKEITSSQELGGRLGISSAQIRKDLSQFGEFGKQGTGYNITYLADQIKKILNVDQIWDVILVGAGDLGHAVSNYAGFIHRGFKIVAVYDNDQNKIGEVVGQHTVKDVSQLKFDVEAGNIEVAMLAVPAGQAQDVSDDLVDAGIVAILCYAPISLKVPPDVFVQYIDPALHLQHMAYYLK